MSGVLTWIIVIVAAFVADAFLRKRDEEYARAFPLNLKHGHYKGADL